jgi:hypothetical protein
MTKNQQKRRNTEKMENEIETTKRNSYLLNPQWNSTTMIYQELLKKNSAKKLKVKEI